MKLLLLALAVLFPQLAAAQPYPAKPVRLIVGFPAGGSAGSGSITHLAGELLKAEARVDLVHVPYKGAAKAVDEQFSRVGGIAAPTTPQDYIAFIAAEQAKWSKVVQAIGFKE